MMILKSYNEGIALRRRAQVHGLTGDAGALP